MEVGQFLPVVPLDSTEGWHIVIIEGTIALFLYQTGSDIFVF